MKLSFNEFKALLMGFDMAEEALMGVVKDEMAEVLVYKLMELTDNPVERTPEEKQKMESLMDYGRFMAVVMLTFDEMKNFYHKESRRGELFTLQEAQQSAVKLFAELCAKVLKEKHRHFIENKEAVIADNLNLSLEKIDAYIDALNQTAYTLTELKFKFNLSYN